MPDMSDRTTPPFRADHVGSLLRPPDLLRARADEQLSADELRAIEDEAIRGAVRMQEEVGLKSATDGEFRRASWHMDFIYQLGGISKSAGNLAVKFHNADGDIEFTPAAMQRCEEFSRGRSAPPRSQPRAQLRQSRATAARSAPARSAPRRRRTRRAGR